MSNQRRAATPSTGRTKLPWVVAALWFVMAGWTVVDGSAWVAALFAVLGVAWVVIAVRRRNESPTPGR